MPNSKIHLSKLTNPSSSKAATLHPDVSSRLCPNAGIKKGTKGDKRGQKLKTQTTFDNVVACDVQDNAQKERNKEKTRYGR
jgi:hypothetical protein